MNKFLNLESLLKNFFRGVGCKVQVSSYEFHDPG